MLLAPHRGFLFVHIPKTGGTSVRAALKRAQRREPLYPAMWLCKRLDHLTGHRIAAKLPRHASVVAAKEMLPEELFRRLFKFAFVRNPWDLQVSSWHHLRRERPHLLAGVPDFESFIKWKLDPERPYQFHLDTSIRPQWEFLVDLRGEWAVDLVGRYEHLADDYDRACGSIGIRPPRLPERRRARDREDYRRYYDTALAERVGEWFARDAASFGYRFE